MNLQQSLERILKRDSAMADLFYEIFLDRYPEVQEYFVGIDLKQQGLVLQMALLTVSVYAEHHYPSAEEYLKFLGHKHQLRNIPANLLPDFRDCLLETLERFHGNDWSPELRLEWRRALDEAIDAMRRGYGEEPVTY